ncbi:MAG: hypothetical protein Q8K65_12335 [Alphaproteobacteria bacterium]|nr:hypothetical protein [Alphaproteobacteria bacterium]
MSSILIKNKNILYRKHDLRRAAAKTSHRHEFLLQSRGAGFIKNACLADSGDKSDVRNPELWRGQRLRDDFDIEKVIPPWLV